MRRLIAKILIGILTIWISTLLFDKVKLAGGIENLLLAGSILGVLLFFVKPIVNLITLPLRLLTLGFFSILINMFLIFVVDVLTLDKFEAIGIIGVLEAALVLWILNIAVSIFLKFTPKKQPNLTE